MIPGFRSLQVRILLFFLGLFIIVQAVAFFAVNTVVARNADAQIKNELLAGGRVFDRLIKVRTERLVLAARTLSGDFGFKTTFADGDKPTLLSAMRNYVGRIQADVMQLVSLDGNIIADTLHPDMSASMHHDLEQGRPLELQWLSGGVVDLGAKVGVPTPLHRAVRDALILHAAGRDEGKPD